MGDKIFDAYRRFSCVPHAPFNVREKNGNFLKNYGILMKSRWFLPVDDFFFKKWFEELEIPNSQLQQSWFEFGSMGYIFHISQFLTLKYDIFKFKSSGAFYYYLFS